MSGINMVYGILQAAIGAALLALGMNVQRYGMTTKPPVPFIKYKLPQFWVWLAGLLIYFVANGVYACSLLFAPLSLLAGIFTTLLVWNLYIGKRLLGEKLTPQKYQGAGVVMFGIVLTVSSTSAKVPTEFSTDQIEDLFTKVGGCVYMVFLVLVILVCVVIIVLFEKKYPLESTEMSLDEEPVRIINIIKFNPAKKGISEMGTAATRNPGDLKEAQKEPNDAYAKKNLLVIPSSRAANKSHHLPLIRSFTTSFDLGDTKPLSDFIRHFSSYYVKPCEVHQTRTYHLG